MSTEICKAKLKQDSWPYGTSSITCDNKVWKEGFCKRHHPEEKRRRQRERDNKKDLLFNKNNSQ